MADEVLPRSDVTQLAAELRCAVADEAVAKALDERDALRSFRDRFLIPKRRGTNEDCIYLCGNSLGLQPKTTKKYVLEELEDWENMGVEGHFVGRRKWVITDEFVLKYMAQIVGAKELEVAVMNSLTVNLHLMMVPFYRPTKERYKILMEAKPFPSDWYAVESQIRFHGFDPAHALVFVTPREGEVTLRTEDIISTIEREGSTLALILFSGVQYYTGQFFDLCKITAAGHAQGAIVGFDLAHAVGNVELHLHDWNVDFACWCSYKYLNAGPGCIGGCFVHERHAEDKTRPRFAGWWGHRLESRFDMDQQFDPIPGAFGFRLSNPPVLCVASLLASLEIFVEAGGMKILREKSEKLTGYLEMLLQIELGDKVAIFTPKDPHQRGCQLSLHFRVGAALAAGGGSAKQVQEQLEQAGVICDVRKPDVLRVTPVPLYNSYSDVYRFVKILKNILK